MLKKFLISLIILNLLKSEEVITGGFTKQATIDLCKPVYEKILQDYTGFKDYEIKSCETQVVNGTNFRMKLETAAADTKVQNCFITVFQSLDKKTTDVTEYREKENDCFTKFNAAGVSTGSVNGLEIYLFLQFLFLFY